jgi:hypothetical protein
LSSPFRRFASGITFGGKTQQISGDREEKFGWIALEYLFQVLLFVNIDQDAPIDRGGQVTIHDLLGLKILVAVRDDDGRLSGGIIGKDNRFA